MNKEPPRNFGDRIVFWVALAILIPLSIEATYSLGVRHGKAMIPACSAPNKTKSLYDLTPRQLRRMIRYEKMKGQP